MVLNNRGKNELFKGTKIDFFGISIEAHFINPKCTNKVKFLSFTILLGD